MSAIRLGDADGRALVEAVYAGLAARGADTKRTSFLDGLILRVAGRAPAAAPFQDHDEDVPPPVLSKELAAELGRFVVDELLVIRLGELYPTMEKIVETRDDAAFLALLEKLNEKLKIKGILWRRGLDPDREYPGLWSKIWESLTKWDGRDFVAYVGRVVRNYCTDDAKRRKKAPGEVPDETADARPTFRTADTAGNRDAIDHVLSVMDELEDDGSLAPIDGVIFSLLTAGRAVQDIAAAFADAKLTKAIEDAIASLVGKRKLEAGDAVAMRFLLDGLDPDEVTIMSGRNRTAVAEAHRALRPVVEGDEDAMLLARGMAREGLSRQDVDRARKLTTNAINLRINRARLKVWMALCDKTYDTARRRGAIDAVALAIVQHRCTAEAGAWCRMYKDRTCKRERTPEEIAARASLGLSADEMARRVDAFRETILDGLGRAFPDYNSCLNERKPDRRSGGPRP